MLVTASSSALSFGNTFANAHRWILSVISFVVEVSGQLIGSGWFSRQGTFGSYTHP